MAELVGWQRQQNVNGEHRVRLELSIDEHERPVTLGSPEARRHFTQYFGRQYPGSLILFPRFDDWALFGPKVEEVARQLDLPIDTSLEEPRLVFTGNKQEVEKQLAATGCVLIFVTWEQYG